MLRKRRRANGEKNDEPKSQMGCSRNGNSVVPIRGEKMSYLVEL